MSSYRLTSLTSGARAQTATGPMQDTYRSGPGTVGKRITLPPGAPHPVLESGARPGCLLPTPLPANVLGEAAGSSAQLMLVALSQLLCAPGR